MGDLVPILIQQGNVQDLFKFAVIIIADIGISPPRLKEGIPLFPNPNCMGFNPGKVLKVFNGKCVYHLYITGKIALCLIKIIKDLTDFV
jgi:hypothetical protein